MKISRTNIRSAAGRGALGLAIFLFPLALGAAETAAWDFTAEGDFIGWRGEGLESAGPGPGVFQVRGGEEFRLFSPPALGISAAPRPYLRIRLRPQSPRVFRAFWIDKAGRPVLAPAVIQPPLDRNFHTFWIPLAEGAEYRGTIETLGLIFAGRPGWVEIDSIEIRPFSTGLYLRDQGRGFLATRPLTPGSINGLSSPRLFGKNLAYFLNLAALAAVLGTGAWWLKAGANRQKTIAISAGCLLALWLISDLRETLDGFRQAGVIYSDYLRPPPKEKSFPGLGDFYHFADFCREQIPPGAVFGLLPYSYWPYDVRLKNLLYPARLDEPATREYLAGEYPRYLIVYRQPDFVYDPLSSRIRSRSEGRTVSGTGRLLARYDSESFIFQEETP